VAFVLSEASDDAHMQVHPDPRRMGLAQSLLREGLLRLRSIGALDATVDTGDMEPANRLYDSLGFT
jgi:ribosomal protein S18 acetylase RimI-like enzyme